jgi:hypothetical protein
MLTLTHILQLSRYTHTFFLHYIIMNPYRCYLHTIYSLFPQNISNKKYVYQINILHIIGVLLIQIGPLLPPKYMPYYILYLSILLSSYALLNNQCFMTVLSNHISKTNFQPLCFTINNAQFIMIALLFYAILLLFYPKYSLYTFVTSS